MSRLQAELRRLFLLPGRPEGAAGLVGPDGQVRALVLEFVLPAGWAELAAVWQGVQSELHWPAPAIAVSGTDASQLWFPLQEPVAADVALACLQRLCERFVPGMPPERLRLHPAAGGDHLAALPPAAAGPERWSAFVAPDLAPLFADEPWLDHPPGAEPQAELLSRLTPVGPEAFRRGLAPAVSSGLVPQPGREVLVPPRGAVALPGEGLPPAYAADQEQDPRSFLLAVMRDPAVDLRLRVEAAKALLPTMP